MRNLLQTFTVGLLFIALFLFSVQGITQSVIDEFTVENVAHLGGEPNCVVSNGTYLYFSQALDLNVLSFNDGSFQKHNAITLVDGPEKMLLQGDKIYAFSEWSDTGIQIIDISNPLSPVLDAQVPIEINSFQDVCVDSGIVFLASGDSLQILSIEDPQNPALLSNTMISANGVALIDSFLFVGGNDNTVIYNISNPSTPARVNAINSGRVRSIQIYNNYAYIATDQYPNYGILIYDISDPLNPQYVNIMETKIVEGNSTTFLNPFIFAIQDDYIYVPCSGMDTYIIIGNISDPQNPVIESQYLYSENSYMYFSSIAAIPNYISATIPWGSNAGLTLINVSDSQNPAHASNYQEPVNLTSMVASGDTLFVSSFEGLWIYKFTNFEEPDPELIAHTEAFNGYIRMVKNGQNIYAIKDSSISILDVNDLNNITLVHKTKLDQSTRALQVVDNDVYVITGIEQPGFLYHSNVNLEAPESIEFKSIHDLPGDGQDFVVNADSMVAYIAYFTDNDNHGIEVLDISNPDTTELLQTVPTQGKVTSMCMNDSLVVAASLDPELIGFGVQNQPNPNFRNKSKNLPTVNSEGNYKYYLDIFKIGFDIHFRSSQSDNIIEENQRAYNAALAIKSTDEGAGLITDIMFWNGLLVYSMGYVDPGLYFVSYDYYVLTTLAICSSYMPAMLTPMANMYSMFAYLWFSIDGSYYHVYGDIYGYMGLYMQYAWLTFVTSVESDNVDIHLPTMYNLSQNYPNPFNPSTSIEFSVNKQDWVTLQIYDIQGRLVQTLANQEFSPGTYTRTFDAKGLASGVYFYRIKAGNFTAEKKMLLVR